MKLIQILFITISLLVVSAEALTENNETVVSQETPAVKAYENNVTIWGAVKRDYVSFYSLGRLARLGVGFGVGAAMANTDFDQNVQDWYQDDIRSETTDKYSKVAKVFGEGKYLIPLALLSASVNYIEPESPIGVWGVYTSRAYLVGAPIMLLMQVTTGGSRPDDGTYGSEWRPFQDNNGVSGHAFMGAVPFLTIAHMYDDVPVVKYLAYAASFATAWSRVNDNNHYLSQVSLGWYMAYESADAVFDADRDARDLVVKPLVEGDIYGVSVQMQW